MGLPKHTCDGDHLLLVVSVWHGDHRTKQCHKRDGIVVTLLDFTDQWLREPKGYGVDLIMKASGPLPPMSMQRVAMDGFRDFPVSIRSVNLQSLASQIPRELHQCLHHSLRLPVVWSDARLLPELGVPRLFSPPVKSSTRGMAMGTAGQGTRSVKETKHTCPPAWRRSKGALYET